MNFPDGWRANEQGAENMGMVAVFTPDVNVWEVEEQVRAVPVRISLSCFRSTS